MPNPNYVKGRRKEYKIRKELLEEGFDIVQRTAGSHCPFDLIAVDIKRRVIKLVQCKPDKFNSSKIEEEFRDLNNVFRVEFVVI